MSKMVTCNGCFDGLHPGHLFFLGYARAQGENLIIGINSDDYISRKKRPKPNFNEIQRRDVLLSLGIAKDVIIFNEDNPIEFIKKIKPDIHCVGEEYKGTAIETSTVESIGGKMCWVPRTNFWTTSKLDDISYQWVVEFLKGNIE